MWKSICPALICLAVASAAGAQELTFPEAAVADPAALSKAMPDLAKQVITIYKEGDQQKYLDNLFRLQIVAGQFAGALHSIASLRERIRADHQTRAAWIHVQYEIYARAKLRADAEKLPFNDGNGYRKFQNTFPSMGTSTPVPGSRGQHHQGTGQADQLRNRQGRQRRNIMV